MKGDIVMWMSGRGIKQEDWDRIFGKKEEVKPTDDAFGKADLTELTSNTDSIGDIKKDYEK